MARYSRDGADFGAILRSPGVRDAVVDIADQVADRARALAPVDDGEYKASIAVRVVELGGNDRDRPEAYVVADVAHGAAVEFGNSRTRGRHVLARALTGR